MQMCNATAQEHTIRILDRKKATITGVEDVDCFNEQVVVLRTPLGMLTVTGAALNIAHLNLEEGRVEIEGEFDALEYSGGKKRSGMFAKLFR
ncbi:MAG: sporulation protein YabP [Clostridiales bacterium]|nr:sporulation protein YabP [Clostridiales bacterium]